MIVADEQPRGDHVQPFQIETPGLRGRLVRLGPAVEAVLAGHAYPPAVAGQLAEAMAMAAVLASGLKYDGIFTLQLQGDGPIRLMVVDVTSSGDMRGYARFDEDRLPEALTASDGPVPRLFGAAFMSFTVDQGPGTDRYQGITPMEGRTLGDCCHAYFRQSEQLETAILLCASATPPLQPGWHAAALMLQRLPAAPSIIDSDAAEDDWRRAVILMSSATPAELLAAGLSSADLLYRLFHEDGIRLYRARVLRHRCRCSREKVERTLRSFPMAELMTMREDGLLRVTCEFCKAEYAFDEPALARLDGFSLPNKSAAED